MTVFYVLTSGNGELLEAPAARVCYAYQHHLDASDAARRLGAIVSEAELVDEAVELAAIEERNQAIDDRDEAYDALRAIAKLLGVTWDEDHPDNIADEVRARLCND